jgi:cytochrome P450
MDTGRRSFLSAVAATLAAAETLLAAAQGQGRHDSSHIPSIQDPAGAAGPDDVPLPPRADPKVMLKEEQKELRRDVDRLLQMVKDLKDESDKTPETDVLSLSLVKRAEDIEKLARQIKEHIRAS